MFKAYYIVGCLLLKSIFVGKWNGWNCIIVVSVIFKTWTRPTYVHVLVSE